MTVQELIDELSKFPGSLPVTYEEYMNPNNAKDPKFLNVKLTVWTDTSHRYGDPDFLYVNIE